MKRLVVSGGLWMVSIGMAFGGGWFWATESPSAAKAPEAAENTSGSPAMISQGGLQASEKTDENNELAEENQQLKEKVAQLQAERDKLSKDFLQLMMKQIFDSADPTKFSPTQIRSSWNSAVERILANHGKGMFDSLEDMINLSIEMASYGKVGLQLLNEVINNRSRPSEERELALQILSRIRNKDAFEYLLKFRDGALTELDYPYDLIRYQVASLPTQDIAADIPGIINQINTDLGADNFSPERAEVLYYLASVHNNAEARRLLNDARMWDENLDGMITSADNTHDQAAYDLLAAIEQNHNSPRMREQAARALDSW